MLNNALILDFQGAPVDVGMSIDIASIDMVSEVNMVSYRIHSVTETYSNLRYSAAQAGASSEKTRDASYRASFPLSSFASAVSIRWRH